MQTYQCHKRVQAAPIVSSDVADNVVTYRAPDGSEQGYQVPASFFARGIPAAGDYLVIYEPDGYASWSPEAAFEAGYTRAEQVPDGYQPANSVTAQHGETGRMTFGDALEALKDGKRVARAGWNGKGMWLELVISIRDVPRSGTNGPVYRLVMNDAVDALPWIGMKTADNKFVPWLASQTDMLADDWCLVEA